MRLLFDRDLQGFDISRFVSPLREYLIDDANRQAVSPPRHAASLGTDQLVFTIGGDADVFGFRAYSAREGLKRDQQDQIVACWDKQSHKLLGIAVGHLLGAWRTGLLGGIARQTVGPINYDTCGIIGTGLQAETQAKATAVLSPPKRFLVFSRDTDRRAEFAEKLAECTGIPASTASSARQTAEQSDILIVATNAPRPVIEVSWLASCRHVTTVGPKAISAHELPADIISWAEIIVSDSPQQIASQGKTHFLASKANADQIIHVGKLISQVTGARNAKSLFLSAGLSGTEVALLAALIRQ